MALYREIISKYRNVYLKFLTVALLLSYFNVASTLSNNCKIKMAMNRMSLAKKEEKLIYSEGQLDNDTFGENSLKPYTAPAENGLEYFYIFEDKLVNKHDNHDKVKTLVTSTDASVLEVSSQVSNSNSEFSEGFDMTAIEVKYNCLPNKSGKIKISMLVTSDQCDPFTIYWIKECVGEISLPAVTISFTDKGGEIVKEGQFVLTEFKDSKSEYTIPNTMSTLTLFLSSSKPDQTLTLKEPNVVLNEENLVPIFQGELRKGGVISTTPQALTLAMACTSLKKSRTDLQIKLTFDNNQSINLFFIKECDTTQEIQEYFSVLTLIYWAFLILIAVFLVVLFFYYLKKNNITVFDLLDRIKEFIQDNIVEKYLSKGNRREIDSELAVQSSSSVKKEKLFEDEENLDVKITSGNKAINQSENKNTDYGGI